MNCNLYEKCKKMRKSSLCVLTKELKDARTDKNYIVCQQIMYKIQYELLAYKCKNANILMKRIDEYSNKSYYQSQKVRILDMLIAELETFIA